MIEAKVTNPNEIKIAITIELPIAQWREIKNRVAGSHGRSDGIPWFGPLNDILLGIQAAIATIEHTAKIDETQKPSG